MAVREIPMLFSAPMVQALMADQKTQTRRLDFKGKPGDLIWVKESWRTYVSLDEVKPSAIWAPDQERGAVVFYEAGGSQTITRAPGPRMWLQDGERMHPGAGKLRPSMFLPRWGSRLTLRVKSVRREPLQSISEGDAFEEGTQYKTMWGERWWECGGHRSWHNAPEAYAALWCHLNGRDSWDANPTVSVISFEVLREGIASITQPRQPESPE